MYTFNGNDYSGSGIKKADTLYYVSVKNGKNYVCERNLTTNKESKIFSSSKSLSVVGVEGKYIYYTKGRKSDEGDVTDLYVYNMDTKQEKFMLDLVYSIDEIIDGKVFCRQDFYLMDYDTADVYSFDLDGTNKQKFLENVFTYFSYNNKIYWCEADYVEDEGTNYILRCCDMNGENKTTVTEWMFAEYPEDIEYMYSKEYVIENYIEN